MLEKSIFQSITAQQSKLLDQTKDAITEKGLGKFGIQPKQLELLGYIKPGLLDLNAPMNIIKDKLSDPAVFTGINNINSLDDILGSEILQENLVAEGMEYTENLLKQSGILTGAESVADTATMLGSSMVATGDEIVNIVNGQGDEIKEAAILAAGKASQFATSLAEGPGKEVIKLVTSDTGVAKVVNSIEDAIDLSGIKQEMNNLIGNPKVIIG